MLLGSQQTMEGVQKHEGGWVGLVGHSEHVAAGTVRSITDTAWIQGLPPVFSSTNETKANLNK